MEKKLLRPTKGRRNEVKTRQRYWIIRSAADGSGRRRRHHHHQQQQQILPRGGARGPTAFSRAGDSLRPFLPSEFRRSDSSVRKQVRRGLPCCFVSTVSKTIGLDVGAYERWYHRNGKTLLLPVLCNFLLLLFIPLLYSFVFDERRTSLDGVARSAFSVSMQDNINRMACGLYSIDERQQVESVGLSVGRRSRSFLPSFRRRKKAKRSTCTNLKVTTISATISLQYNLLLFILYFSCWRTKDATNM